MKIICDLCEQEKPAKKSDGIWVCKDCDNKFPKITKGD